jgi:thymidylate synthase
MKQYIDALKHVLWKGEDVSDRTGVGTKSIFGYQMRFDLTEGFPAVTTKKLAWRSVVSELLWFLEGSTDERRLAEILYDKDRTELDGKNTIWTANADKQGVDLGYRNDFLCKELGPVYGHQWRDFNDEGFDQINYIIHQLKNEPDSRRIILSAWNPNQLEMMALPPCHTLAQFKVNNGKLSCQLYQRSADMFLGVPFNIASYSLLTHMLSQICDLEVADFVWVGGDVHIYSNHIDQVRLQIQREPRGLPTLEMPKFTTLEEILNSSVSDYVLRDYNPMESIKAPMAV